MINSHVIYRIDVALYDSAVGTPPSTLFSRRALRSYCFPVLSTQYIQYIQPSRSCSQLVVVDTTGVHVPHNCFRRVDVSNYPEEEHLSNRVPTAREVTLSPSSHSLSAPSANTTRIPARCT